MPDELAEKPVDFVQKGKEEAVGWTSVYTATREMNVVLRALQGGFGSLITVFLKGFASVSNYIARALIKGESGAEDALSELQATAVSDLLDVNVNPSQLRARGGGGSRGNVGDAMGAAIINALVPRPASLEPSDAAVQHYVSAVAKFGLEGWLSGFTMEFMSSMWGPFGHLETFGELDDILARSLGFQGLSRSALGPYVDTLIRTPAEWQLHKLYRPHLLTPTEAVRQYTRGRWSREQLNEELARQGYSDDRIEALVNSARRFLSTSDLYLLFRYGEISRADFIQHLRDQGWEEADAARAFSVERLQRIDSFQKSLANVAIDAYANRRIEAGDFDRLIGASVSDAEDRARLREIAEARRALDIKDLSESDAKDAVLRGILSVVDYRRILERAGYTDEAVMVKELQLSDVIRSRDEAERARQDREAQLEAERQAKEAERLKREQELEAERAVTEPSLAQAARFVVRGIWTTDQYAAFLRGEKYDAPTIAALLDDVLIDRDAYLESQAAAEAAAAGAARKGLSLAQLESAVLRGILTLGDYRGRVRAAGFDETAADVLTRTLESRVTEQRALEARREQLGAAAADKGLSLSQAEQAVLRGIGTLADYDAWLRSQGYAEFDRTVLVALLESKLADQEATAARRAEQEAAAAARDVPLAEIRRAVLLGVRSVGDYEQALVRARLAAEDRVLLADLLRAELAQRAEAERVRAEAAARRPARRLSLAQLEALVRADLLTPDAYRAELAGDGWSPRDVELLTSLLLDQIEAERQAREAIVTEETPPAAPTLTLDQIARAVRAGLAPLGAYETAIRERGYADPDVRLLVGLLETELEARAAADARRADLLAEDPARALSVSQLERAVRSGVQTLDDYEIALRDLTFEPTDAALLTAVLARDLVDVAWAAARRDALRASNPQLASVLDQREAAVIGGRSTLEQYRAELAGLGLDLASQTAMLLYLEDALGLSPTESEGAAEG